MSDLQEKQEANEIQDREMMEKMGDAVNKESAVNKREEAHKRVGRTGVRATGQPKAPSTPCASSPQITEATKKVKERK